MCLIAFAIGASGECPLLLASNRDEWWLRPTTPLAAWHSPSGVTVWSGRDQEAGGTWLGFNAHGRVAMLTNVRPTAPESAPRSRGELVLRWLDGATSAATWADLLRDCPGSDFNGCNLVLGDLQTGAWGWFTNRRPPAAQAPTPLWADAWWGHALAPGVYALSNAYLDTPWPKTLALKAALHSVWADARTHTACGEPAEPEAWHQPLLQQLMSRAHDPDAADPAWEQPLSSPFVHVPQAGYGTRSSLLARCVPLAHGGHLELHEWTHAVDLPAGGASHASHWPAHTSVQRRFSINRWGMPTSS